MTTTMTRDEARAAERTAKLLVKAAEHLETKAADERRSCDEAHLRGADDCYTDQARSREREAAYDEGARALRAEVRRVLGLGD